MTRPNTDAAIAREHGLKGTEMTKLKREIVIDDITPEELAELFTGMFGDEQARFFSRVGEIAATWPGAGWCQQCCSMSEHFDKSATETILKLAEWAAEPYQSPSALAGMAMRREG